MRKLFLILVPVLLVLSVLLMFFDEKTGIVDTKLLATVICGSVVLFVYGYMFLKGVLKKQKISIPIYLSLLLIIVGTYFQVQYWSYGNICILTGCLGILIFYSIHFIKKPKRYEIDWMKYLYLVTLMISVMWQTLNYPYSDYIIGLALFLCLTTIVIFYCDEFKGVDRRPVVKDKIADDGNGIFIYNDPNNSLPQKD